MSSTTLTVAGHPMAVDVAGPDRGNHVVLLGAVTAPRDAYAALCARLHNAALRTVVISTDASLRTSHVMGVLDAVGVRWAVLFGDRAGAERAWELAATSPGRFTALVAVDRGHPRASDESSDCPPVECDTTMLFGTRTSRAQARASQRYVYADFRQVPLLDRSNVDDLNAQLAAEIVLRSNTW
ncbi:MAG: alpha/beta hydrolase [Mycobacterium sp.]|nr:alpha/beta hydrolase [Mycobacterium sp.]